MLVLPLTSDPSRSFTTDLADGKYTIETRYNERSESWTFDVTRDVDQVRLLSGVPLLIGQDMLAPYALQIGGLIAADMGADELDASPEDLGERVIVTWLSQDELVIMGLAGIPGLGVAVGDPGTTDPVPDPGTGGGTLGGMYVPLVDLQQHADDSGDEVIACQFTVDLTPNASPTIVVSASFLGSSESGTAVYRAYIGGSFGAVDGAYAGSAVRTAPGLVALSIAGAVTNPGGLVPVKITMQSSGPGSDVIIDDLTGSVG